MIVTTNEDKEIVEEVRRLIKENDGYCCCAVVHDEDHKCMCKDFRDKISEGTPGECHCGLYVVIE